MAIKTPIIRLGIATLLIAGCHTARERAVPQPPLHGEAPKASPSSVSAAKHTAATSRPPAQSHSKPKLRPQQPQTSTTSRTDLAALIGDGASWTDDGNTILVTRGGTIAHQPVPLFRQAGMLAAVRAALADSPIHPWTEFRHGLLVLTFTEGSNSEIAAAVNKALSASEARNAKVMVHR